MIFSVLQLTLPKCWKVRSTCIAALRQRRDGAAELESTDIRGCSVTNVVDVLAATPDMIVNVS